MRIYYDTAKEYIEIQVAVCGEVDKSRLAPRPRAPFTERSINRAVAALRQERVILKHKYDDGRTFLRMSSVSGFDYLGSISPTLRDSAALVISPDGRYSGSKEVRLRERSCYELYFSFADEGVPINFIEICRSDGSVRREAEDLRLCDDEGLPRPLGEVLKEAGLPERLFLTRRLIKKRAGDSITKEGSRGSRIAGTLICSRQVYHTYALSKTEGAMWKPDSELSASSYINGVLEGSDQFRESGLSIEKQCILFCATEEDAEILLLGDTRIDPCKVYRKSYVIPRLDLGEAMLTLFGIPLWEEKMTKLLLPDSSLDGIADGVLPDTTEVYNFIGCNLNRIRYAATRINSIDSPVLLFIQPWMSKCIHGMFPGGNVQIAEIEDSDISMLTDIINKQ